MNKKFHTVYRHGWCTLMLVLLLACLPFGSWAQSDNSATRIIGNDSVRMRTSIYFSPNGGDWIEKSEYKKVGRFLRWALSDTVPMIELTGWTDKSGSQAYNEQLSARRARSVHNYLVGKGVSAERIRFKGCGVDNRAANDSEARRVDLIGLAIIPVPAATKEKQVAETVEAQPKETKVTSEPEVAIAAETSATVAITETAEPVEQASQSETTSTKVRELFVPSSSRWYVGVGGGVSFGRGTFCSFAMDDTRPGFNVGVLGGYEINRYLSAELSLDYTRMTLGTYDCCQNLWLASDGNRYFAPLAGATNYQYNDLRSTTHLVGLGAHLNIDLVGIWKDNSRWSALIMPAIYGVVSSADVKQLSNKEKVKDESAFHFGVGADVGVGYMITPCWGLRLKTGISLLTGEPMDAMPKAEHKSNYVWATSLQVIFKL